jgi:uncharacterized protein YbaR (Trm112 family)
MLWLVAHEKVDVATLAVYQQARKAERLICENSRMSFYIDCDIPIVADHDDKVRNPRETLYDVRLEDRIEKATDIQPLRCNEYH